MISSRSAGSSAADACAIRPERDEAIMQKRRARVDVPYRALPDPVPHEVLQEEEVGHALFVGACRDERGLGELLHELLLI